nr:hypothetical protein 86 [bacterium]
MEWFKKLNIKFKMAFVVVGLFLAMFLFVTLKRRFTARSKLNFELARNTHEIELANLEADAKKKEEKLEALHKKEQDILRQLEAVEAKEAELGREMSVEELDSFFDSRGF